MLLYKSPRKRGRTRRRGNQNSDVPGSGEKRAGTLAGGTHPKSATLNNAIEKVTHQNLTNNGDGMAGQSHVQEAHVQKSEVQKVHQDTKHQLLKQRKKLIAQLAKIDSKLAALEIASPIMTDEHHASDKIGSVPETSASVHSNTSDNADSTNDPAEPRQRSPRGCIAHWTKNDCRYGDLSECNSGSHVLPYQHEEYALQNFAMNPSIYRHEQARILKLLQRVIVASKLE